MLEIDKKFQVSLMLFKVTKWLSYLETESLKHTQTWQENEILKK